MEIIRPFTHLKEARVNSWKDIKDQALEMREFIKNGTFEGNWDEAFAISHMQVSLNPKHFFVLNEDPQHKLIKAFGSWVVINLKILNEFDKIEFSEGCMSFPHRAAKKIDRFYEVKVEYEKPSLFGMRKVRKKLTDIPAMICQHEEEHSRGVNMYGIE